MLCNHPCFELTRIVQLETDWTSDNEEVEGLEGYEHCQGESQEENPMCGWVP